MEQDFSLSGGVGQYQWQEPAGEMKESSVDDFIHGRTRILKTKLEVLALEIRERFVIRGKNLERIDGEKERVSTMMDDPRFGANYFMVSAEHQSPFLQKLFDLETHRRSEDVECWRDVVQVMRDFLMAWEAHEQAKAKAIFLNDV